MATLLCFHAHPDDEASLTAGTMARASDEDHRVVLVVATDGALGEVPEDLGPGETLVERRRLESQRSADLLGVARVVWLGYRDSGMTGWEQNEDSASFLQADVEEAAQRLAIVLVEEAADVLTIYDWHGNYGHPDHVQVHRVGVRAAELAGTPRVFEATMNRDHIRRLRGQVQDTGAAIGSPGEEDFDPDGPADDGNPFGMEEAALTHAVDVSAFIERKREAVRCHASQVTDTSFLLQMPTELFSLVFGTEWFIERGFPADLREGWLLD